MANPVSRLLRVSFLLCPLAILLLTTGCHPGGAGGPVRGIWVTRYDYKTPDDVVRIMDNCQKAGFNAVLFQVRGNGTVAYKSKIEPWAEQFNFKNPGFDPLELAIKEAHSRDMQLHAWVNVMPAWRGPGTPAIKNQLYHTHPEWFWYDKHGKRQPIHHQVGQKSRDWYVSLNPCLPEVRKYLVGVFREIVSNYDVDGLHMDYIRFPNERTIPGEKIPDYPRDKKTLELFRKATGHSPESNPKAWNKWRTQQVTALVSDVKRMMETTRPEAVLSAAVSARPHQSTNPHFQDGREWVRKGYLDKVFLMNYTSDVDTFSERIDPWLSLNSDIPIVPGLSISDKVETREGAIAAKREIEIAHKKTGNYCLFAYSSLFDSVNRQFATKNSKTSKKREVRRQIVIPAVKTVSTK